MLKLIIDQLKLNKFKARRMGHYGMVSLWCASLLTDSRFSVLYFKMNNCLAYLMLHQEKELPNDSGRPLRCNNFTDKRLSGYHKKLFFCIFCHSYCHLSLFEAHVFTNVI